MEDIKYWMWSRRKFCEGSHHIQPPIARATPPANFHNGSWEEQAFAEDSACIWPPRSYTCSFCKREFKSAQALGGHMNVHRRDRALLRQASFLPLGDNSHSLGRHIHGYPQESEVFTGVCNPNYDFLASPSVPPRVSVGNSIHHNCKDAMLVSPPSLSSSILEEPRKILFLSMSRSLSDPFPLGGESSTLELMLGRGDSKVEETSTIKRQRDSDPSEEKEEEKEESVTSNNKRQKTDSAIRNTGTEELDLELRLGNQPKTKWISGGLLAE